VTYLRLRTTRLLPSGKELAICKADATRTRVQTSSFIGRCLYLASKTLVLYSLQRQTPCVPRSKCVSNCLYPEGFPVLRLLVLFYQGSCTFAHFLIRLPTSLCYKGLALGRIVNSLIIHPDTHPGASAIQANEHRHPVPTRSQPTSKPLAATISSRSIHLKPSTQIAVVIL
jgi:hypothetical protein